MTPLGKAELVKKIDNFIVKGGIELRTSGWSSPVLFIPKPNDKLEGFVWITASLTLELRRMAAPFPIRQNS